MSFLVDRGSTGVISGFCRLSSHLKLACLQSVTVGMSQCYVLLLILSQRVSPQHIHASLPNNTPWCTDESRTPSIGGVAVMSARKDFAHG